MTNTIKKTAAGVILAAVAMFGVATTTSAQTPTIESLLQMIAELTAQLNTLQGGSSTGESCGVTTFGYTAPGMTLQQGSTGASVSALQAALNNYGGANIGTDGIFGPGTRGAVVSFQASKGLMADGIAGPNTTSALASASAMTTPCPTDNNNNDGGNVTLSGNEGDVSLDLAFASDMQIDLGDREEVIEFDIEAMDGDVQIDRVDFTFDARPWLYFSEVNLLVNGNEVASLSGSGDFSQVSGNWRARFSGLNEVIREDDIETFVLELRALSSLPADRLDDTVNIVMSTTDAVRFMDGSGAIMTAGLSGVDVDVTFAEDFGTGELDLIMSTNSPKDATIVLNETSRTEGVTVLVFDAEADDSDLEVTDVEVTFSTTGSTVAETVHRAYLYRGNTLLKQKSVTANTVMFDDVDFMIDEDDMETLTVKVDFNRADSFTLGNFVVVSATATAEDADFVATSDTITVTEGTHVLISEGLTDSFVSKSTGNVNVGNNTNAKFTFTFDLTAYENNYFLAEDGTGFEVTVGGTSTTGTSILSRSLTSNAAVNGDAFQVNKNNTRQFTLEVEVATTSTTQQAVFVTVDDLTYFTNAGLSTGTSTLDLNATSYKSSNGTVVLAP